MPVLAAILALLASGCDLADFEPIVEVDALPYPEGSSKLTLSGDATRLWVSADGQDGIYGAIDHNANRIRAFDTESGEILADRSLASDLGFDWGIVGLAPEFETGHEQDVWVLHNNGYQLRWSASLEEWNDWELPPPGIWKPCDIARTPDGATYITSRTPTGVTPVPIGEGWSYYLHKRSPNGQWSAVEFITDNGSDRCPQVAYDRGLDRVAVLILKFGKIRVYSPALEFISETDISGLGGWARDLATINSVFVLAVDGSYLDERSITVIGSDGVVMDKVPMDRAVAVDMQVEDGNLFHVWWTGRDILGEHGAGRVLLTGE